MPVSSVCHAFGWFAAVVVVFLFYVSIARGANREDHTD